jgi:hypothetical protein
MRIVRLLLAVLIFALPAASYAQVRVAIRIGPPAIPIYEQPICPGDGYLWTPGYWAYDDDISDYYWVPGLWVNSPEVGFLWTPGYWGWGDGGFFFNDGYWGPTVGFYGGINYGFGYFGEGFGGGRWDGGHFFYNRAVLNVDVTNIHNVYNTTIVHNDENRVSYNGGQGGLNARPTPEQEAAAKERHIAPVAAQTQHVQTARSDPQSRASVNHGRPPAAAGERAGEARTAGAGAESRTPTHASDLPKVTGTPANSGDAKADKKYQQQQDKLIAKQNKEQDQLQKKQDAEHQKKLNDTQHQQMEQKHQQQTQQLQQRHSSEMQEMQSHAPAPRPAGGRPR